MRSFPVVALRTIVVPVRLHRRRRVEGLLYYGLLVAMLQHRRQGDAVGVERALKEILDTAKLELESGQVDSMSEFGG